MSTSCSGATVAAMNSSPSARTRISRTPTRKPNAWARSSSPTASRTAVCRPTSRPRTRNLCDEGSGGSRQDMYVFRWRRFDACTCWICTMGGVCRLSRTRVGCSHRIRARLRLDLVMAKWRYEAFCKVLRARNKMTASFISA
ncbi:hypothetical protein EV126DRAFT_518276 [Verticillium dahliae]|nr:hypothetical protein EV126DRAFT_518276 [Verticillium dahliae]